MAAKAAASLPLFLLLLSLALGTIVAYGDGGQFTGPPKLDPHKTWCVAKPSSDQATLLANLNYACSQVDCGVLQKGCSCFYPDNLISHASTAMNLYYQAKGRNHWNCDFRGSGLIVMTDPSYNNCIFS